MRPFWIRLLRAFEGRFLRDAQDHAMRSHVQEALFDCLLELPR